ncbi:MAG: CDP-alcohol phosphatidyltransferase family protein [Actinobacteria bacterium]|nr:CDP-alcohol phosphatidyltransferase family protein [Actinomycetota bacterium]
MEYADYESAWVSLHGQAQPTGLIRIWLRLMFLITTPLIRVRPNAVTLSSGVLALALVAASPAADLYWVIAVGIFVLGLLDGIDGVLAVRRNAVTEWGGFLDSMMDRVVDVAILAMLLIAGADPIVTLIAGTLTLVHEYMRTRAASVGYRRIGKVTIAEKPTRIILGVIAFTACAIAPSQTQAFMDICAWAWLWLAFIGFTQLFALYRRELRAN